MEDTISKPDRLILVESGCDESAATLTGSMDAGADCTAATSRMNVSVICGREKKLFIIEIWSNASCNSPQQWIRCIKMGGIEKLSLGHINEMECNCNSLSSTIT